MNDNGKEFFEEIQPNILKLKEHLRNINSNLTHYEIEPFQEGKETVRCQHNFRRIQREPADYL
ncbi:MAG TPA: hypothetical protein VGD24_06230 [Gallionella sp.]